MKKALEQLRLNHTSSPLLAFPNLYLPSRVKTDASSVALAAILGQEKEDAKFHPIQFASLTMNDSEHQ